MSGSKQSQITYRPICRQRKRIKLHMIAAISDHSQQKSNPNYPFSMGGKELSRLELDLVMYVQYMEHLQLFDTGAGQRSLSLSNSFYHPLQARSNISIMPKSAYSLTLKPSSLVGQHSLSPKSRSTENWKAAVSCLPDHASRNNLFENKDLSQVITNWLNH